MKIIILIILFLSIFLTGCGQSSDSGAQVIALPTRALLPTTLPTEISAETTQTRVTPIAPPSLTSTELPASTLNIATPTALQMTSVNLPTPTPLIIASPLPPSATRQPVTLPPLFSFGQSHRGADLVAHSFGSGDVIIMLVGGIHSGFEANTTELVQRMVDHFNATPSDVLSGVLLILIPALNPDGALAGSNLQGRFNANGVDLNRNWGCGWQPEAFFRETPVSAGVSAFSEPETAALASLISDLRPQSVVFYHSAANGVFSGACDDNSVSDTLAQVLGNATNYPHGASFDAYPLSGTASNWVDSLGIPSVAVELASSDVAEFDRNLRGVMALQCWLLGMRANGVPQCG